MNVKALTGAVVVALALWLSAPLHAQEIDENFNSTTAKHYWHPFSGACLTAGTLTASDAVSQNQIPGCIGILSTYFNLPRNNNGTLGDSSTLVGGANGFLGSSTVGTVKADPDLGGALRLTNGHYSKEPSATKYIGYFESGAIVSDETFPTGGGVQITFKTIAYSGDSGGTGADGADGISFYLMDGCMPMTGVTTLDGNCRPNPLYGSSGGATPPAKTFPGIGANGGSLAYSCSNNNTPYDGLVGAYLGLGIDEYGNFLNGVNNTLGETGGTVNAGDNTASGGTYQPGRIGLRGAGSVSWQALNTAYGTPVSTRTYSPAPYYPASMATSCAAGTTYIAANNNCASCPSGSLDTSGDANNNSCINVCKDTNGNSTGTFSSANNMCNSCPSGAYSATSNSCVNVCTVGTYVAGKGCNMARCTPSGTYNSSNNSCSGRNNTVVYQPATTTATTTKLPATAAYSASNTAAVTAVQKACKTGELYDYTDQSNVKDVGPMVLGASYNPAGILDYNAMAFNVPTVFKIANESAVTRTDATPILYTLNITQDGFLTFSYSIGGGTLNKVIDNQNIITSNGQLPNSFRFGFAGSTGGSTNVHEILCFKATPTIVGNGSGGVTQPPDETLRTGAQQFVASYFPSDWSGSVTATPILFDKINKILVLGSAPLWDGGCVLTGGACSTTGASSGIAETPDSRVMLTWDGGKGVPFKWASLSTAQQTALNAGDSQGSNRLDYLRGVTTNEIKVVTVAGVNTNTGLFRKRNKILGDIVDSSPSWIGPPTGPYSMGTWMDQLYPGANIPENAASATKYSDFQTNNQGRLNVVYAGANDGFLHGFRAGTLDAQGNLVPSSANDGNEVLAYMPAAVVNSIHPTDTTGAVVPALDYSDSHYTHAYYVDATPATGDVFYGNNWHTLLAGGLGSGGAALYALDVTDPSTFSDSTARNIVIGEWNPGTITCANATTVGACGPAMGNTFGTPEIRRFHNGDWGVIFGNGYGALDGSGYAGAAGIYIMLIDSTSGSPSFYYLPAAAATKNGLPNGIANATSLDIDLDHIVDYIYAGDLLGNVWRFDVTSSDPASWAARATPLFTAPYTPAVAAAGNTPAIAAAPSPITTRIVVGTLKTIGTSTNGTGSITISSSPERVILDFGTGQQVPQSLTAAAQYSQGPQFLYGIWDWDFGDNSAPPAGTWNYMSSVQKALALGGSHTISPGTNMQVQTITVNATTPVTESLSHNVVCWLGDTACGSSSPQTMLGWYTQLPHTREQVIFDPVLSPDGTLTVTSYAPLSNSIFDCKDGVASTYTIGVDAQTGAGLPTPFFNVGGQQYDGVQLNGTGSPSFLSSGQAADNNAQYLLTQTISGTPAAPQQVNRRAIVTGQRMNWIQRR